ncbi:leucine-rich repeat protein [Flavobacterium sp. RS13.1]|uniref:leucine-rich repeat protein n=1 Tax=Flavobacterium sp. RS13.1 TaxID=3400345 RepID=UPI003AACE5DD
MSKELDIQNLIRETIDKNLPKLDFYSIDKSDQEELTEIPDILFDLTNIEELDLSIHFSISEVPIMFQRLKSLKKLTIKGDFEKFPISLIGMKSLTELTIYSDTLTFLPQELDDWDSLTYLNISGCPNVNSIIGLPPNLIYIYIVGQNFKEFPDKIFGLHQLYKIVLRNFRLKELPKGLFKLKKLAALFAGDNFLSELPNDILELSNLREIWLDNNLFEKFPEVLFQIKSLKRINLRSNLLQEIPDSISNLTELTELSLGKNKFKEIPPSIFKLKKMMDLQFGNINIGNRDEKENINEIRIIPNEILNLENLENLELDSKYIENVPEEIVREGVEPIKNFLRSLKEADQEEFLYEAKMVVVGRGDVGKTVLTKKLTFPNYSLSKSTTTKGINILKNPFDFPMKGLKNDQNFRFNIWDFGGQEKYDATHQLFITNRSIYLFLTEARSESNYHDVFYWLNNPLGEIKLVDF